MYRVYVLKSKEGKYYIGQTSNFERRLREHSVGVSKWTRKYEGWKLIYSEEYKTRSEAMRREKYLKSFKGGNSLRKVISCS